MIDSKAAGFCSWFKLREIAETSKESLEKKIQTARSNLVLERNMPEKSLGPLRKELDQFEVELKDKLDSFCDQVHQQATLVLKRTNETPPDPRERHVFVDSEAENSEVDSEEEQGLTVRRIRQFEKFTADELFVDKQCMLCFGDIKIGRNMMRLDCNAQHTFCQVCIEGWFADHNTCPICRHTF